MTISRLSSNNLGYRLPAATFDEGASSGVTFSTLTNPDGDGKNYRVATVSAASTATLAIAQEGLARALVVGSGGGGGHNLGGGGGGGGVMDLSLILPAQALIAKVGTAGAAGSSNALDPVPTGNPSYLAGPTYVENTSGYGAGLVWAMGGIGGGINGTAPIGLGGGFNYRGGSRPTAPQAGRTSTISGASVRYGDSGGIGAGQKSTDPGSGGNGGNSSASGTGGVVGIIIVSVEI